MCFYVNLRGGKFSISLPLSSEEFGSFLTIFNWVFGFFSNFVGCLWPFLLKVWLFLKKLIWQPWCWHVFRNKPQYRQIPYSSKLSAFGLQRHGCHVYVWDGVKQNELTTKLMVLWNITKHFGAKDTRMSLKILCYDEIGPKSTYDSR